jgi:hypothetical protein
MRLNPNKPREINAAASRKGIAHIAYINEEKRGFSEEERDFCDSLTRTRW